MTGRVPGNPPRAGTGSAPAPAVPDELAAAREFHRRGQLEQAALLYRSVLARAPSHYEVWNLLGQVLLTQGDEAKAQGAKALGDDALACFDRAIALKPDFAPAFNNRGKVLRRRKRQDEALASFDRAIALKPDHAEALLNRGSLLHDLKRIDEAIASYDRAIALKPDYAPGINDRGLCKLLAGRMASGWADHEYRWKQRDYPSKRPILDAPHWTGENLAGRSILVYEEQGLGDTIQFSRFLPLLAARGATVSCLLQSNLARLLAGLPGNIRFLREPKPNDRFDFQIAMMSLPYQLGIDAAQFAESIPYLAGDPARTARWAAKIGGDGFKIGICWQGSPASAIDAGRSIPLREFYPLSQIPGVRLIGLQKYHGLDQIAALIPGMTIEMPGDGFDGGTDAFMDTAAAMAALDLIVTSDTAMAHVAGALGRPVWVALKYVPDWRWMLDRSDSPWYPTMRLFRQNAPDDWRAVFRDIAAAVNGLVPASFSGR